MKKPLLLLAILTLTLASFNVFTFAQEDPPWMTWEPDLTSQGVSMTEPFESYVYDPDVVTGGTLVISTPSDPPEQHQWNAGATASYDFLDPMMDYLCQTSPVDGSVVPWIAYKWDISEDKLSYTVYLTEGVKFHDGTELTSEDVAWCYQFAMDNQFPRMSEVWDVLDPDNPIEIIDDYTIKFNVKDPYVIFAYDTLTEVAIVPKHVWEPIVADPDFDWFTYVPTLEQQVGCGPFKLVEYVPNSYYKFEAFDDYWHGRPYVDELLRPIIVNPDAELLALKRGDTDVFTGFLPLEAIPSLLKTEGVGLYMYSRPYMYHWGLNNQKWPFDIKEFRYAMAYAVDKQDLVDTLLLGYGIPGPIGIEAPFWGDWYNPDVPETYTFNLTKAAEILDDLGFVDTNDDGIREGTGEHAGEPIAFDVGPPIYDPVRVRAAELIAENLQQIGIDATVLYLEWATLWGKIIQPLDSPEKVDTWLLGSSQTIDPGWMKVRLYSQAIPNPNYYGFVNAEFDELCLLQSSQFDVEERKETIWRMQEILAEEVPFIVMYFRQEPAVYRTDKLTGWVKDFDNHMDTFYNYIWVRPIVELMPVTISIVSTPPPEVDIGDSFTLGIKYSGPEGEAITDAEVLAMIEGEVAQHTLDHVGEGTYEMDIDTSGWASGDYVIRVEASATGYDSTLTTFSIEAVEPEAPPPPSFWESYGATITGVVVVLAVIAVAAVYMLGRK